MNLFRLLNRNDGFMSVVWLFGETNLLFIEVIIMG